MEGAGSPIHQLYHISGNIRIDTSCDLPTKIHVGQGLDDPDSYILSSLTMLGTGEHEIQKQHWMVACGVLGEFLVFFRICWSNETIILKHVWTCLSSLTYARKPLSILKMHLFEQKFFSVRKPGV